MERLLRLKGLFSIEEMLRSAQHDIMQEGGIKIEFNESAL